MPTGQDGSCPRRGGRDSWVGGPEDNHPQIAAPLRTLRAPFCALALAPRTGLRRSTTTKPHF